MKYFSEIDEGNAIIVCGGVYYQRPLYQRDGRVYVKHGSGFVRLLQGGTSSIPKMRWLESDTPNGRIVEGSGHVTYEE